jgi:hypothetical protein
MPRTAGLERNLSRRANGSGNALCVYCISSSITEGSDYKIRPRKK